MVKTKKLFVISLMLVAGIFGYAKTVKAQPTDAKKEKVVQKAQTQKVAPCNCNTKSEGVFSKIKIADILATLLYSLMGLIIALFGYQVYDWITPFDLRKELEIDQNTSLGIVAGSIILGLCIIVAAAIVSP
jgi:putative membrane protein